MDDVHPMLGHPDAPDGAGWFNSPNAAAMQPETYANPAVSSLLSQVGAAVARGFMAPGQALASTTPITSDQMIAPAMDMAGMTTLGAGAIPQEANTLNMGIKAYHGSPHDFNAFDLSKIGTGEGAQAYGHGLYFAENEGTAKAYRDQLAYKADPNYGSAESVARDWADKFGGDRSQAISQLEKSIASIEQRGGAALELKKAISLLETDKPFAPAPTGKMYEVNINADPEHFLDWDKPLSEQPPKVKEILGNVELPRGVDKDAVQRALSGNETPYDRDWNPTTGAALYRQIAKAPKNDPNAAASQLAQSGIPGIKYLDAGSRASGDGSRNYVVFNDKLIDIMKKYAIPGMLAAPIFAGDKKS